MMNKSLSYYIQNYFLSYMIAQRGYGSNTISSYRDTFKLLFQYLSENGRTIPKLKISDVNRTHILGFLDWLETNRKNSVATRNVRLAHIKSFFGHVLTITPELSEHFSQIMRLKSKKTEKKPPKYLTETETEALLKAPDGGTINGLRHLSMLTLLYDSACRVQELIDLNVADITIGSICKIFVKGKGKKEREVPILPETGKILLQYIKIYRLQPNQALFSNKQGNRLTRAGVSYILNMYAGKSRGNTSASSSTSPHKMRHSKASHLISHGVSIYDIRDFLGHESVVTTQIYLTSSPEAKRAAIEKAALKTTQDSDSFFSDDEKEDLLEFLTCLIN